MSFKSLLVGKLLSTSIRGKFESRERLLTGLLLRGRLSLSLHSEGTLSFCVNTYSFLASLCWYVESYVSLYAEWDYFHVFEVLCLIAS